MNTDLLVGDDQLNDRQAIEDSNDQQVPMATTNMEESGHRSYRGVDERKLKHSCHDV